MFYVSVIYMDNAHLVIKIGKIKIKYRKSGYFFAILCRITKEIKLLIKIKSIKKPYIILPLGTYCFSRCITTFNKLKPDKKHGEKTCPFDLAFFNNIDGIIHLLNNNFEDFYDDLKYDSTHKYWTNNQIDAVFNHDGELSSAQFKERYNARIKNFYNYLHKNCFKYIVISSHFKIMKNQAEKLVQALDKIIENDKYKIVIINQSKNFYTYNVQDKIFIINQNHNTEKFNKINCNGNWVGELRRQTMPEAKIIFDEITTKLIDYIKATIQ